MYTRPWNGLRPPRVLSTARERAGPTPAAPKGPLLACAYGMPAAPGTGTGGGMINPGGGGAGIAVSVLSVPKPVVLMSRAVRLRFQLSSHCLGGVLPSFTQSVMTSRQVPVNWAAVWPPKTAARVLTSGLNEAVYGAVAPVSVILREIGRASCRERVYISVVG